MPEPWNHIHHQNTPRVTSAIKRCSGLITHSKKTFFHMGPLSAKQSHSFSLKSTCLKLLRVVLPQHQILQFKKGKSQSELEAVNVKGLNLKEPKREATAQPPKPCQHLYLQISTPFSVGGRCSRMKCWPAPHHGCSAEATAQYKAEQKCVLTTPGYLMYLGNPPGELSLLPHGAVKHEVLERRLEWTWLQQNDVPYIQPISKACSQ